MSRSLAAENQLAPNIGMHAASRKRGGSEHAVHHSDAIAVRPQKVA
jgi:hypothetical protein